MKVPANGNSGGIRVLWNEAQVSVVYSYQSIHWKMQFLEKKMVSAIYVLLAIFPDSKKCFGKKENNEHQSSCKYPMACHRRL